jgi:Alpha/beta-hydrolase family
VILSHDNDPIAVLGPELLIRRPWWLADGQRGRGVPDGMHWRPLVTFIQTAMDAANAMVSVPGEFGSFGHDRPGRPDRARPQRRRRRRPSRRAAPRPTYPRRPVDAAATAVGASPADAPAGLCGVLAWLGFGLELVG